MQTALVTGASGGIGRAIATRLARGGYRVTAVARNEDKLRSLTEGLGEGHGCLVADLATADGQGRVMDALRGGGFTVLVNNAGVGTSGDFTAVPLDRQLAMLELNVTALTRLAYAFLGTAKSGDALINVSSVLGFLPMPGLGLYSATKAFVTSFSDTLWYEQKARGVFVFGLHPGMTDTDFQANAGGKKGDYPKNMAQTPEQVAEAGFLHLQRRGGPVAISGGKNFLSASLPRFLPHRIVMEIMGAAGKKMGR